MKGCWHKFFVVILTSGFLLLSLAACTSKDSTPPSTSLTTLATTDPSQATEPMITSETTRVTAQDIPYAAHYIPTGRRRVDILFPQTEVIRSLDALYRYYDTNKFTFFLNNFAEAASVYNVAFFEENVLLVTTLFEGSGSIRHSVTRVYTQDDQLHLAIDRLVPEADMIMTEATWHIITEVPQKSLDGRQIDVQVNDRRCDISEMRIYTRPQLTSGGHTSVFYEAVLSEVTYDPATGKKSEKQYNPDFRALTGDFPVLTAGDVIGTGDYIPQPNSSTLWDAEFNVLDQPKSLTAAKLYAYGPGTYYVGYHDTVSTDYVPIAQMYNNRTAMLLATLIVPESTAGMAGQWSALGGFGWVNVTGVSVETRVDGKMTSVKADADSIVKLMARLRSTPAATVRAIESLPVAAQVITLQGSNGNLAQIAWSGESMTLDLGGKRFAVDAPPWLFGMLTRSVLGSLLISQPEAEAVATRDLARRSEMTGGQFSLISAQITHEDNYGYGWDLVYRTATGQLRSSIIGDFINGIDERNAP